MPDATQTERDRVQRAIAENTSQLHAISGAMMGFLETGNLRQASTLILHNALDQTESEYGFIGVIVDGPVLRILAHEGFVWDATVNRELYEQEMRGMSELGYMDFAKLDNLFGTVVTHKETILSNSPATDPRATGIPPGHPPLRSFLGVPTIKGSEVVGMIGVANRSGGYSGTEEVKIKILTQALGVLFDSYRRMQRETALKAERQRAEVALKESEERYRSLYNYTPVMMHSIDRNGKLVSVNDHWLKTLGYKYGEVIGKRVFDFYTEASARHASGDVFQQFLKNGFLEDIEIQVVKKNGAVMDCLLSAHGKWNEQGELIYTMAFLVDITERKHAEEAIRQARDELMLRVKERTAELSRANVILEQQIVERRRAQQAVQRYTKRLETVLVR